MERNQTIKNIEMSTEVDIFVSEIALAASWYGETKNTTGTPNILHAIDVANIIKHAVQGQNLPPDDFRLLYLGALGHDLFEDVHWLDRNEVVKNWGTNVANIIDQLTNVKGDKQTSEYSQNLSQAAEEVRLIKLADILSNLNNSLREFDNFDPKNKSSIAEIWIPMLDKYAEILLPAAWEKYKDVAGKLTYEILEKIPVIKEKVSMYYSTETNKIVDWLDIKGIEKAHGFYEDPIDTKRIQEALNEPGRTIIPILESEFTSDKVNAAAQFLFKIGFKPKFIPNWKFPSTKEYRFSTSDPNIEVLIDGNPNMEIPIKKIRLLINDWYSLG